MMTTYKSMTREDYNRKWLKGEVDQSFLEVRDHNGVYVVNLECSSEDCTNIHVQVYSGVTHRNTHSLFQDTVCIACLTPCPIRVTDALPVGKSK